MGRKWLTNAPPKVGRLEISPKAHFQISLKRFSALGKSTIPESRTNRLDRRRLVGKSTSMLGTAPRKESKEELMSVSNCVISVKISQLA